MPAAGHEHDALRKVRTNQTTANSSPNASLSASVTCRLQHRSLLAYLRELLTANQTGGALPALL